MSSRFVGALLASLCLTTAPVSVAAEPVAPANARFTFEIGETHGGRGEAPRVYQVLCEVDGKMQTVYGSRIPIPTNTGEGAAGSFAYQNIGLTVNLSARHGSAGTIDLEARIEGTLLPSSSTGGAPPTLGTFTHDIRVLLTNGKKVRVVDIGEADKTGHSLDVRADWVN